METAFEFGWRVHAGGYRWVETRPLGKDLQEGKPGRYLTAGVPVGVAYDAWRYNPLHRTYHGLFRTFAELEPAEEAIQRFANEYGLLGGDIETPIVLPAEDGKETIGWGESRSSWMREIRAMRRAVTLWEAARKGDVETLGRMLEWRDGSVLYDHDNVKELVLSPETTQPQLLSRFREGDLVLPALELVRRTVNKHLEGRVSPRLLWEHDRDRLTMRFVPNSLIGALWLQFAQALDTDTEFGRCETCGRWFVYDPTVARTNRRYCSDACRFKAYRERQKKARELHTRGVPLEQIARQLESTAETVRRWIGGKQDG